MTLRVWGAGVAGSAQVLRTDASALPMADESVDLIVTSPPYWSLRSYTDGGEHYAGQIGAEPTPAEYVANLVRCTREWMRVLKPSGSLWVNLGDKYATADHPNNASGNSPLNASAERRVKRDGANRRVARKDYGGVQQKSLIGLPWRYAIACVDDLGLILRAEVIWSKPNGLPESVTDRVRRSHETWFHLTKSPRYFSAVDTIRESHAGEFLASGVRNPRHRYPDGRMPSHSAGVLGPSSPERGDGGTLQGEARNPLGKLPGSVWTIATQPLRVPVELGVDHFAAFPMEWPRRIISGWSPSGICTACGEGRRPVAGQVNEAHAAERARVRARGSEAQTDREAALYPSGRTNTGGFSNIGNGVARPEYRITGEMCACTPFTDHPERRALSVDPWQERGGGTSHHRIKPSGQDSNRDAAERAARRAEIGPVREYHFDQWEPAPTRPAVVLDPFGGTGTTALVASVLGRTGISIDMSADYCRVATWRTADDKQRARAIRVRPRPVPQRRAVEAAPFAQSVLFDAPAVS